MHKMPTLLFLYTEMLKSYMVHCSPIDKLSYATTSGDDLYKLSAFYQILYQRCLYPIVYDDFLIKYCLNQGRGLPYLMKLARHIEGTAHPSPLAALCFPDSKQVPIYCWVARESFELSDSQARVSNSLPFERLSVP